MRLCCSPPASLLAALLVACASGCTALSGPHETLPVTPPPLSPEVEVPRELAKVSLPPYVIEPPDILLIDAVKLVPKPPHLIEVFDGLGVRVEGTPPDSPILGAFTVDPDGRIDLGPDYGKVAVKGMTLDEAKTAVVRHLSGQLNELQVSVSLASSVGAQPITGEHLVGPDGRVNLGTYGTVYVAGLTIPQTKTVIEAKLAEQLEAPEVFVDVLAFNSKVFYVVTDGAALGDNVQRLPITGNETVLDAVASIGGLSQLSSKQIWIARPAPNGVGCEQILPVSWDEITRGASTATNYQILPGDRLFIASDKLVTLDNLVGKITRPFERMFGSTILGTQMLNRIQTVRTSRGALFF